MTKVGGPDGTSFIPQTNAEPVSTPKTTESGPPSPAGDVFERFEQGVGNVFGAPGGSAAPAGVDVAKAAFGDPDAPVLERGKKGPEVKELQNQLNEWRVRNGKPRLDENGFGPKTDKALKEFQKASGLPDDGRADVATQSRLKLENDSNFRALPEDTKDYVRSAMSSLRNDGYRLQELVAAATSPGLKQLSGDRQVQAVHALLNGAGGEVRSLLGDPTFTKLHTDTQKVLLSQLTNPTLKGNGVLALMDLATTKGMDGFSPDIQRHVLRVGREAAIHRSPQAVYDLRDIVGSESFRKLPDAQKAAVLEEFAKKSK